MIELGVNIDHVATLRQARRTYEPDPVWAAVEAHLGGADGITVHLREDRRHIQDLDVERLRTHTQIKLNLEMAATSEMVSIACKVKPEMAMLVPEGRQEITTEGGLDIVGNRAALKGVIETLRAHGMPSSIRYRPRPIWEFRSVKFTQGHTLPCSIRRAETPRRPPLPPRLPRLHVRVRRLSILACALTQAMP